MSICGNVQLFFTQFQTAVILAVLETHQTHPDPLLNISFPAVTAKGCEYSPLGRSQLQHRALHPLLLAPQSWPAEPRLGVTLRVTRLHHQHTAMPPAHATSTKLAAQMHGYKAFRSITLVIHIPRALCCSKCCWMPLVGHVLGQTPVGSPAPCCSSVAAGTATPAPGSCTPHLAASHLSPKTCHKEMPALLPEVSQLYGVFK